MSAFTLRLDPPLAKKFDRLCKQKGYSKTGLVKTLIREFIEKETVPAKEAAQKPLSKKMPNEKKGLAALVGIVSLGGDSVKDKRELFY